MSTVPQSRSTATAVMDAPDSSIQLKNGSETHHHRDDDDGGSEKYRKKRGGYYSYYGGGGRRGGSSANNANVGKTKMILLGCSLLLIFIWTVYRRMTTTEEMEHARRWKRAQVLQQHLNGNNLWIKKKRKKNKRGNNNDSEDEMNRHRHDRDKGGVERGEEEEEWGDDLDGLDPQRAAHEVDMEFEKLQKQKGPRWSDPRVLPPPPGMEPKDYTPVEQKKDKDKKKKKKRDFREEAYFFVPRLESNEKQPWEDEADDEIPDEQEFKGVDYRELEYDYPEFLEEPPTEMGVYPPLRPLGAVLKDWPQDELDNPPEPFREGLIHFDYQIPEQLEWAEKFRNAELPFKVYNVPEVTEAGRKWTDDYVGLHFDETTQKRRKAHSTRGVKMPTGTLRGTCQESVDNFFAFFTKPDWDVKTHGLPPTRDNDWTYQQWSKHARYADKVGLAPTETHYYWQAGVTRQERYRPKTEWSFVALDLPSFSDTKSNFFQFNPPEQKGIQCRFGERGVTAATHYDAGRNMVAMVKGAKRYILSPPKACKNLGIVNIRGHPVFRHSLLNFAHLNLLKKNSHDDEGRDMPEFERAWLERAHDSMAIDTVLKEGEVLYIPSHWFHYIISLQKSAQCNVRSGRSVEGSEEFGGYEDVRICGGEEVPE